MHERVDRILPETRWACLVVVLILVPAVVILWGLPDRTEDLWAWTIRPDASPIFIGSAYGAGAYFFLRAHLSPRWHPVSAGIGASAVFATLILATTLIHWERFNHGHGAWTAALAFYLWVGAYALFPVIFIVLWIRNSRLDPHQPDPGEPRLPKRARLVARGFAALTALAAGFFLLFPESAIDIWPWQLTPLTSRVLGCFAVQVATGALMLSLDDRWGSWKLLVESFVIATALLLVGAARAWADFDHGALLTWVYMGGLLASGIALLAFHRSMERRAIPEP